MQKNHLAPGSPTPISHDLFRTETLPGEERFSVWRESVSPLFDSSLDASQASACDFQARVESFNLGSMVFALSSFSALCFRRRCRHDRDEGADHLLLQQYLAGGYVGHNGHRSLRVGPGDISLIDLGRSMETRAVASNVLSLVIPRDLLAGFLKPRELRFGTVIAAASPMGFILGNHLQSVWKNLPSASQQELEAINRMLLGSVGGVFGDDATRPDETAHVMEGATLEAMRAYIRAHLDSPLLSPDHICKRFGYSRARLYRLFAPLGGVAAYIRDCRLARCLEEFSRGLGDQQRVAEVAFRWGFPSQSHFSRLFRQTFGISPSEAVERGRQSAVRAEPFAPDRDLSRPRFHHWLRHL